MTKHDPFDGEQSKADRLLTKLKRLGENWVVAVRNGTVVLIGPGSPRKEKPALCEPSDVDKAIQSGRLKPRILRDSDQSDEDVWGLAE